MICTQFSYLLFTVNKYDIFNKITIKDKLNYFIVQNLKNHLLRNRHNLKGRGSFSILVYTKSGLHLGLIFFSKTYMTIMNTVYSGTHRHFYHKSKVVALRSIFLWFNTIVQSFAPVTYMYILSGFLVQRSILFSTSCQWKYRLRL